MVVVKLKSQEASSSSNFEEKRKARALRFAPFSEDGQPEPAVFVSLPVPPYDEANLEAGPEPEDTRPEDTWPREDSWRASSPEAVAPPPEEVILIEEDANVGQDPETYVEPLHEVSLKKHPRAQSWARRSRTRSRSRTRTRTRSRSRTRSPPRRRQPVRLSRAQQAHHRPPRIVLRARPASPVDFSPPLDGLDGSSSHSPSPLVRRSPVQPRSPVEPSPPRPSPAPAERSRSRSGGSSCSWSRTPPREVRLEACSATSAADKAKASGSPPAITTAGQASGAPPSPPQQPQQQQHQQHQQHQEMQQQGDPRFTADVSSCLTYQA
mmetsp:Transcript_10081/g.28483  ORF Transcript_10081/g.28483 Transcript_10081/m.28483 type:complete len:323 (-) Transcript_10081:1567-2535(-)